jgi:hypothetical protein
MDFQQFWPLGVRGGLRRTVLGHRFQSRADVVLGSIVVLRTHELGQVSDSLSLNSSAVDGDSGLQLIKIRSSLC